MYRRTRLGVGAGGGSAGGASAGFFTMPEPPLVAVDLAAVDLRAIEDTPRGTFGEPGRPYIYLLVRMAILRTCRRPKPFGGPPRPRWRCSHDRGRKARPGLLPRGGRRAHGVAEGLPREEGRPVLLPEGRHARLHGRGVLVPRPAPGRLRLRGRRPRGLSRRHALPREVPGEGPPELPPALGSGRVDSPRVRGREQGKVQAELLP